MVPNAELASIATERLVSDQSAAELAPLLTIDQRALIGILATIQLHQLDAATLLQGYAAETNSLAVEGMVERIEAGIDPLDAAKGASAFPKAAQVAFSSSRESGSLNSFYHSWLSQARDNRADWVPHGQTNAAKLGRAFWRALICIWMLFVLLRHVIPEQQRMLQEFGIDWNSWFALFIVVSKWIILIIMPIAIVLLFFGLLYILIFKRKIANNYFRRWLPSRWQQVVLPKKIMTRKLLAWDLLAFRGDQTTQVDWDELVARKHVTAFEADVTKEASSRETQAWLLRRMANRKHVRQRRRVSWGIDGFILLLQLLVAVMTILAAFAIFSTLLDVMKGLT